MGKAVAGGRSCIPWIDRKLVGGLSWHSSVERLREANGNGRSTKLDAERRRTVCMT